MLMFCSCMIIAKAIEKSEVLLAGFSIMLGLHAPSFSSQCYYICILLYGFPRL